jgi:hypothetical protein
MVGVQGLDALPDPGPQVMVLTKTTAENEHLQESVSVHLTIERDEEVSGHWWPVACTCLRELALCLDNSIRLILDQVENVFDHGFEKGFEVLAISLFSDLQCSAIRAKASGNNG